MIKERQRTTRKDKRGRILKKGEGQDKNGRYYFNYVDAYGKRRRIYNNDLVELRQEEKDILKDLEDGINIAALNRTLNEQFEICITVKNIKKTTEATYRNKWEVHFANDLGKKKLTDIRKSDVQAFYKKMSDAGYRTSTIRLLSQLLQSTLESAADDDIIRRNPAKGCLKEYGEKSSVREALTLEQQETLLNFVRTSERYKIYLPFIMFALATACRKSEIAGLRWDDVDLKNRVISINHQLIYVSMNGKYRFVVNPPKSEAGFREIPMTEKCYQALIKQREYQMMLGINHDLEVAGIKNFVFTTTLSTPYNSENVNDFLKNIVNAYNRKEQKQAAEQNREPKPLPRISCHILRHTACTRLAESNIDIKVLQKFMGHSDIKVTMNIYNHVDKIRMKAEIEKAQRVSDAI